MSHRRASAPGSVFEPNMRRILMPRTNNHVYFVIDAATDTVHVHAAAVSLGVPYPTSPHHEPEIERDDVGDVPLACVVASA